MRWTIAVLLLVLWVIGLVTAYTLGGFIHIRAITIRGKESEHG